MGVAGGLGMGWALLQARRAVARVKRIVSIDMRRKRAAVSAPRAARRPLC